MHKVSVVIPIFNVRDYLAECLDSVVAQTIDSLQVILVDNGSTDGSREIADDYAARYDNFESHHTSIKGLGHARNHGVKFADGEYICFLDSDDTVPTYAYKKMYQLAEMYDCDLVVGDVVRFNSVREYPSGLHRRAFSGLPKLAHISRNPSLFNDTTSWNKLFKRSFYFDNDLFWAEGMLYEDIPVTVPAHVLARRVGYLNQVVYRWRSRDGGDASITQRKKELENFADRLKAINLVDAFFDEHVSDRDLHMEKDFKWLDMDFKLYWSVLFGVNDTYVNTYVDAVSAYLDRVDPRALQRLQAIDRIVYWYIKNKDTEGMLSAIAFAKKGYKAISITRERNGHFRGKFPFKGLPKQLDDMTPELLERGLKVRLMSIKHHPGGSIQVRGEACVPRLSQATPNSSHMQFSLVDSNDNHISYLSSRITRARSPLSVRVSRVYRTLHIDNQTFRGFEFDIPESLLRSLAAGDYFIHIKFNLNKLPAQTVRVSSAGNKAVRLPGPIDLGYTKVATSLNAQHELKIHVREVMNRALSVSFIGNASLKVQGESSASVVELSSLRRDSSWSGCLDQCDYDYFDQKPYFIHDSTHNSAVRVYGNQYGELCAESVSIAPVISDIRLDDGILYVKLSSLLFDDASCFSTVKLTGRQFGQTASLENSNSLDLNCGESEWTIDLASSSAKSLRTDSYDFSVVVQSKSFDRPIQVNAVNGVCYDALAVSQIISGYQYSFDGLGASICLLSKYVQPKYENTKFKRKAIELCVYPLFRALPIRKNWVVFESSWGNKTDCNPGAFYNYLQRFHPEYQCIWSLKDIRTDLGGNGRRVTRGSLKYFYAMARTKYLINNVNFTDSYVKRPGQIEIQTMHGTPLKTLGLDVPGELETQEERDRFLRRRARWDYLVVQSPRAKEITTSCYDYHKAFLETGYPRNDSLFARNNPESIANIKERLGFSRKKKLVLYAPTWRVKNSFELKLDMGRLVSEFGDSYEFALRVHQFAYAGVNPADLPEGVHDVSLVKDMEDLLLISDVLITDYSSVMFDYVLLKRPILFYVYDLENYRDVLRGFNVSLEDEAPGPLLETTDDVLDAISSIDDFENRYHEAFANFYEKYCSFEHGDACEQIYNKVFRDA